MWYFQKNIGDEVDLLPADKRGSFLQVDIIILSVRSQVCPKCLNNNFAMSFQYLKKNVKDEVDFLPAVKHQRLLEIDTIILGDRGQTCQYLPKITRLLFLCNILRKK